MARRYMIEDELKAKLIAEVGSTDLTNIILSKLINRNEEYLASTSFGAGYATEEQKLELKKLADQRHRSMLIDYMKAGGVSESTAAEVLDQCILAHN